jgi:SAM-dependent methyltransferase
MPENQIKVNLGCGNKRPEGFIGVDRFHCDGADVLCDITRSLPFLDDSVDEYLLDNLIEHVLDIPALIAEIVRTARNGARVAIITPHFSSLSSWKDPTHIHHLSYFSFDHFEKVSARHYVGGGINVLKRRLSFGGNLLSLIGRAIFSLSPEAYEKKYCFIFRASTLRFDMEIFKPSSA